MLLSIAIILFVIVAAVYLIVATFITWGLQYVYAFVPFINLSFWQVLKYGFGWPFYTKKIMYISKDLIYNFKNRK